MRKILSVTLFILLLFFACGSIFAEPVDAISIEQLFTDGIKREGEIIVAGSVLELEIEQNPFDDSIMSMVLKIGEKGRSLSVFLYDYDDSQIMNLKAGNIIALKGTVLLTGNSGFFYGWIFDDEYQISEYRINPTTPTSGNRQIEVSQYFNENLFIGKEKVVLSGIISERSMAADGTVLFVLSDSGRDVYAYSSYSFDVNKNAKELRNYNIGDKISLLGVFDMESSYMTIFTFIKIS